MLEAIVAIAVFGSLCIVFVVVSLAVALELGQDVGESDEG